MRESLLVGEEVGVSLERNTEALGQDVIARVRNVLRPLDVSLISVIGHRDANIGLRLRPHVRVGNLLDIVKTVVEDARVRVVILAAENLQKLHLDVVPRHVPDRSLRGDSKDQVVIDLGCSLLKSTDDILSNVTR